MHSRATLAPRVWVMVTRKAARPTQTRPYMYQRQCTTPEWKSGGTPGAARGAGAGRRTPWY